MQGCGACSCQSGHCPLSANSGHCRNDCSRHGLSLGPILEAEIKTLVGCGSHHNRAGSCYCGGGKRDVLRALRSVALQDTIRDTMGYWERRLAALSDVTKPTSATVCKETRSINLIAICEMARNASSAMDDQLCCDPACRNASDNPTGTRDSMTRKV